MRNFLEQADASRQAASEIRRHATDLEVPEPIMALKLAENSMFAQPNWSIDG